MSLDCLGVLIYNREDLLARLVASIDHPIRQLVIVNNGALSSLAERVQEWSDRNPNVKSWVVYEPGQNLGVAGGWNVLLHHAFLGIAEIPNFNAIDSGNYDNTKWCDSILICGNDIEFAKGDLAIFEKTLNDFPEADAIFGNHSFSNFMLKRSGYEKCGHFDENFYEAYGEDGDFWQRFRWVPAKAIHAAGLRSTHAGSATINSDAKVKQRVQANQARSQVYYGKKWGCPPFSTAKETFQTPFNRGGSVTAWELSPERKRGPHYLEGDP